MKLLLKTKEKQLIIIKIIGGLGNQMFQYAFYRSLKEDYKDIKADTTFYQKYISHNGYELERIFTKIVVEYANSEEIEKISDNKPSFVNRVRRRLIGLHKTHYREIYRGYNRGIEVNADGKYFEGYWQSEKYFISIKNIIQNDFTFSPLADEKNIALSELINEVNSISIHVRRGDYLENSLYSNICNKEYYEKSIRYIQNSFDQRSFFVFSDDIEWCKINLDIQDDVQYIDWNKGSESYIDMQLMSMCKHNIIANSSFSWWGAWLNSNPDKIVMAPKRFLNSKNDLVDIIPDGWIKI